MSPVKKDDHDLFIYISLVFISIALSFTQQLPNLPIPLGAGTCEVWNNSIYHFGGSNNWSGSICYPRVYRFDGTNWAYEDSIPDNNMWGVTSVLVGDDVYLIGAWPYGPELNRRYNLNTGEWVYLAESPNTYHTWGISSEWLRITNVFTLIVSALLMTLPLILGQTERLMRCRNPDLKKFFLKEITILCWIILLFTNILPLLTSGLNFLILHIKLVLVQWESLIT